MALGQGRKKDSDRVYASQSVYFRNPDTMQKAKDSAARMGMSFSEFMEVAADRFLDALSRPSNALDELQ